MKSLAFIQYEFILLFGVFVSASFSGMTLNKKNSIVLIIVSAACSLVQLIYYLLFGLEFVFKIYPFIVHLPLIFFLCLYLRNSFITNTYSVLCAYLFLQISKWFAELSLVLFKYQAYYYFVHCLVLIISGYIILKYLAPLIVRQSKNTEKTKVVMLIVPLVYYIFDYVAIVYNDWLYRGNRLVVEFLPFMLSLSYLLFCMIYLTESQKKNEIEMKNQVLEIQSNQLMKEMQSFRENEYKLALLRHDTRHYLQSILLNLENNNQEKALTILHQTIGKIDKTRSKKYCENESINMILSFYHDQMERHHIKLESSIQLQSLYSLSELEFSSILCNGLENAIHEQIQLPRDSRYIYLLVKKEHNKILISIKNPYAKRPKFKDGIPVSTELNHGYGCESINYFAQKLNGTCQFSIEENLFVLKVIIFLKEK